MNKESPHITLRWKNTDPLFISRLKLLEQAMIEKNLDPSAFIIDRNLATFQPNVITGLAAIDGFAVTRAYEYKVNIKNESFTVTKYGDLHFLEYFSSLCMKAAVDDDTHTPHHEHHLLIKKIREIIGWLEKDPLD